MSEDRDIAVGAASDSAAESAPPRDIALLFLVSGLCFFPLIFSVYLGFFNSESEADWIERAAEHPTVLRLLLMGIGVTEVALGVALLLWGQFVSGGTVGRRSTLAQVFGWVGLAGGCACFIGWSTIWLRDAESLGADAGGSVTSYFIEPGQLAFSLTLIFFGWVMIRGTMPTWLGAVWIACALLYWPARLPLWFFVAAIAFGIRGVVVFRPGRDEPDGAVPSGSA